MKDYPYSYKILGIKRQYASSNNGENGTTAKKRGGAPNSEQRVRNLAAEFLEKELDTRVEEKLIAALSELNIAEMRADLETPGNLNKFYSQATAKLNRELDAQRRKQAEKRLLRFEYIDGRYRLKALSEVDKTKLVDAKFFSKPGIARDGDIFWCRDYRYAVSFEKLIKGILGVPSLPEEPTTGNPSEPEQTVESTGQLEAAKSTQLEVGSQENLQEAPLKVDKTDVEVPAGKPPAKTWEHIGWDGFYAYYVINCDKDLNPIAKELKALKCHYMDKYVRWEFYKRGNGGKINELVKAFLDAPEIEPERDPQNENDSTSGDDGDHAVFKTSRSLLSVEVDKTEPVLEPSSTLKDTAAENRDIVPGDDAVGVWRDGDSAVEAEQLPVPVKETKLSYMFSDPDGNEITCWKTPRTIKEDVALFCYQQALKALFAGKAAVFDGLTFKWGEWNGKKQVDVWRAR